MISIVDAQREILLSPHGNNIWVNSILSIAPILPFNILPTSLDNKPRAWTAPQSPGLLLISFMDLRDRILLSPWVYLSGCSLLSFSGSSGRQVTWALCLTWISMSFHSCFSGGELLEGSKSSQLCYRLSIRLELACDTRSLRTDWL